MSLTNFSVNNPQLINMIMIVVFVLGIYTMITMPKEEMPAMDMGRFIISVAYPGVSPQEMENLIVNKIEDEISDLDDVDYISSTVNEGMAIIRVVMEADAKLDQAWNDLNTELEKVTDLPEDANDPQVTRLNMREVNEICSLVLSGDFSDNALRDISEDLKDVVLDIDYVSKVEIAGIRKREIWVEADMEILNQNNIGLNQISQAIANRNYNVPGGNLNYGNTEYILRNMGAFNNLDEIEDEVVRVDKDGGTIRIKHVATVKDTLEEQETIGKLNGIPSVNMSIYKKAEGNIIDVIEDIKIEIANFEEQIPGLTIELRNDGSIDVKDSINTLSGNAILGILLVFITLFIFIGWKNAILATWGIPFTFMLTFFLMHQFDVTINNLSLFGLILVLGMIVDDAIIVLENVHRYTEKGLSIKEATIKGTSEIMWPVIAAILTTGAAFLPMIFLEGRMGKFLGVFPIVVSIALAASLIEALIILPSHITELGSTEKNKKESNLTNFLQIKYEKIATWVLGHRWKMFLFVGLLFLLSLGLLAGGFVKFEFFPQRGSSTIVLNLKAPTGTNLKTTDEIVSKLEDYIISMPEKEDLEALVTNVGQLTEHHRTQVQANYAELKIDLLDADEMKYSHEQIRTSIRKYLETLKGISNYAFKEGEMGGAPTGNDVELRILGEDYSQLEKNAEYIQETLNSISGVTDIESNIQEGKKEIRIVPHYQLLKYYGLEYSDLAELVRTAAYGNTISKFHGSGIEENDIVLKVAEEDMATLNDVKNLNVLTNSGDLISIDELADFVIETGYSEINHYNQKRVVTITANTSNYDDNGVQKKRTPSEVTAILKDDKLANFSQQNPGIKLEYGGQAEQQKETYNSLYLAFAIAILLIYTILSTQFRSYVQPLIVIATVPCAFIGVIFGLYVTGLSFSVMTLMAVVALAGIVVNDSLVLVDFVSKQRIEGIDRWNSLINAGMIRLRPILMTTTTTIAGFLPIILSTSSATENWKPMAVSIAFGLVFGTTITLFIIPVLYSFVDSFFGKLGVTRFKKHLSYEDAIKLRNKNK
ncbi:MAG: efflux RND transporter permease subunit [Candidatus Cloacimonadota bacterium]|nr:efflux RND transporter permease subunit [Candidatus Cloacimonadota bacterium]